ncbi:MAG: aminoacyl-histidine dipeptidase [Defluviitaleaceae bacterium]|nr:aminoacyl-histidine dipeptidase [Defluviitaleaceae bacterium]
MKISDLQPTRFFTHFEALSQIPRGSGNEQAASDFVAQFARDLGCKVVQDALMNVIVYKPASPGYEDKPAVILQGHLDMVCEKNADTVHDFEKDPLDLYLNGDHLKARGTTLGADNGTAIALCMALLEDKAARHPALEMIFTVEEETGMAGAEGLDAALFSATRMLNLDSSDEGIITIGCAAGVTVEYELPITREDAPQGYNAYTLAVKGLHGGHSGGDINKGRANALVLLGCVLAALDKGCDLRVSNVAGGMKLNAIPREATAKIFLLADQTDKMAACIAECQRAFAEMYKATEPGLAITYEAFVLPADPLPMTVLSKDTSDKLIASLLLLPNGVQAMGQDMPDVVAASCNVGVVKTDGDAIIIECFPRGATADYLKGMEQQIRTLAERTGASTRFIQRSPAWAFDTSSALLKTAVAVFEAQYGHAPKVTAVHAGLECGILAEKLPGLDIISVGPQTDDLHTPDERLSISSLQRVSEYLSNLLAAL